MTTNGKIKEDIQVLNVGSGLVDLYDIDLSAFDPGNTVHITPMTSAGTKITFGGVVYDPLPIEAEGFAYPGNGQMPRPTIKVSNINLTFTSLVDQLNDLIGAKVTRRRTYAKYLDGAPEADSSAQFPSEVYFIERKVRQNKFLIEWELKASVDVENVLIPKGQVLDICQHRYRIYDTDTSDFDYSNATCPYVGTDYFDDEGNVTTKALDKCGKKLFDCKLRFVDEQLPMRAFPGVGSLGFPYR